MSVAWKQMDELRTEHGYAAARFVRHWKTGEEIAGGRVESEVIDGQRMWRIVPTGQVAEEEQPPNQGVITFADLEVGDEFEFRHDGRQIRRYRKTTNDPENAQPIGRNAIDLDTGSTCFFAEDATISFEHVALDLPDEVTTREELVEYCAEMIGQVLVVWTPPENLGSYRAGMTVNVATRHLDGTWTWAREIGDLPRTPAIDLEMDPCATCGQHHDADEACQAPEPKTPAEVRHEADRAQRPCNCIEPGIPDGASGWTRCTNRCGGYVWVDEPDSDPCHWCATHHDGGPENCPDVSGLEDDIDGELLHVEIDPPRAAALESRVVWPDEVDVVVVDDPPVRKIADVPLHERLHPALSRCRRVSAHPAHTDEWYAARAASVGSSDAGAILGVSPHATIVDVWRSKVGGPERSRPWLEPYGHFGTWFEFYLREYCEGLNGINIIPGAELGLLRSIDWPQAAANIDGLDEYGVIEEIKTSSEKWDTIPEDYVAQVQHQMFVTGCIEARIRQFICPISREHVMSLREHLGHDLDNLLASWLLEAGEVVTWIVERDDSYIARLVEREREFWTYVESNTEPPILDPDGTVDLSDDPEVYTAVVQYAQCASVCAAYKPDEKAADAAKKEARIAIERAVALLGDRPKRVVVGDHKATFVSRSTHSYWQIYANGEANDGIDF